MKKIEQDFIKKHDLALLSTSYKEQPHGAAIYYIYKQKANTFYFVTKLKTQKAKNLLENKKVALTIFEEKTLEIMHIDGVAKIFKGDVKGKLKLLTELNSVHSGKKFVATPPSLMEKGELDLIEIQVKKQKYYDFSKPKA